MIVIVDDEDRENEGDLMIAAEMITPEAINFMATRARGLICMAITSERADALELSPMVLRNTSCGGTAFTVSVDAKGRGVTTGISAYDRAQTVLAIVDTHTSPEDLARPGHIFPLRARRNGVLERRGHTEAAVDLARLAGLDPSGVICEIANDDGTMACLPDLIRFCSKHDLEDGKRCGFGPAIDILGERLNALCPFHGSGNPILSRTARALSRPIDHYFFPAS